MTPLRQRLLEDMQLRGFSARTQECYASAVRQLAAHYHRSPDQLTEEDLRQYFLYLANEKKVARATATIALCGIRFFFEQTLRREWTTLRFVRPAHEHKLPVVLSRDEVRRVLAAVRIPVYRVCLTTILCLRTPVARRGAPAGRRYRQCADGGARPRQRQARPLRAAARTNLAAAARVLADASLPAVVVPGANASGAAPQPDPQRRARHPQ